MANEPIIVNVVAGPALKIGAVSSPQPVNVAPAIASPVNVVSGGAPSPGVPKGGTTGQFLRKASETNFDSEWDSPSPSDIGAAPESHTHTSSQITDSTAVGRAVLTAADAATARTAIDVPSSAQLAGVQATAEAALPKEGGTLSGTSDKLLRFKQTGHPAAAGADFAFGIGGANGYASSAILWTRHEDGPYANTWVRRLRMDAWGSTFTGIVGADGIGARVEGQGTMSMLSWESAGAITGTCWLGHTFAYEGFGRANTYMVFGPESSSHWSVWSAATYQLDALKLDLDFSGNLRSRGNITPITDISASCGDASRRWTQVHAQDGTIQTSDARLKSAVEPLSPALIAIGLQCARETGRFRWLARIAEVGEAARWHIGITSQRVVEIFAAHGEDAYAYGIVCHDEWPERTEIVTPAAYEQRDTGTLDEHGAPIYETVETTPAVTRTIPAGDAYSLRYDELSRLIAAAMIAQQDALEARVTALEGGA